AGGAGGAGGLHDSRASCGSPGLSERRRWRDEARRRRLPRYHPPWPRHFPPGAALSTVVLRPVLLGITDPPGSGRAAPERFFPPLRGDLVRWAGPPAHTLPRSPR